MFPFVLFLQIYFFLATLISLFFLFPSTISTIVLIINVLRNGSKVTINMANLGYYLVGVVGFFWLWTLVH